MTRTGCPILAVAQFSAAELVLTGALLLLLLLLSASFSASETTLFSLSRAQIEQAAASTNRLRRLIPRVMAHPKQALMTVLVANTTANVLFFAISYVFSHRLAADLGRWVTPVSGLASVLLVVLFAEVTPKVLAVRFAERLAPFAALAVRAVSYVAGPVNRVLDVLLVEPCARVFLGGATRRDTAQALSADELKALLELSRRRGEIDRVEDTFLREVIDLSATRVRDVMVPRVEVVAYDVNAPPEGLRELMRRTRRKKVPVYQGTIDHILGLVYAKMLFPSPVRRLKDVLMPVRFVPELATCEHLLHHFRQTKTQLVVAVDEYGGMAGLVTLEDVLEEIVGEISTPEDELEQVEIRALSEREYEVSGRLDVRYWAELFALPRQVERVATVGGLVAARLGRPAQVGDVVRLGNVELRVTSVQRRRVEWLRLRLLDGAQTEPAAP